MVPSPDLVNLIQRDRERDADASRLARLAATLGRCCAAPRGVVARIVDLFRAAPQCC